MTLNSKGTYEAFVAKFNAADGTGKWAIDGGSAGMDYFFILNVDSTTGDIYIGGNVYGHPPSFHWGDVTRANSMHGSTSASERAFFAQIKPTTALPSCLESCSAAFGTTQASAVKTGHCYIDRHCYAAGDYAPYPGAHCRKCDPTTSSTAPISWSDPDTSSMCFIDGQCVDDGAHAQNYNSRTRSYYDDQCRKCDAATSTSAWTEPNGCQLDMSQFQGGSFHANGTKMAASMQPDVMLATVASMTTASDAKDTTIASMTADSASKDAQITTLEANNNNLQEQVKSMTTASESKEKTIVDLRAAKEAAAQDAAAKAATIQAKDATIKDHELQLSEETKEKMPTWATALIVVVGAILLMVLVILAVLVSREQAGKPVFMASVKNVAAEKSAEKI